MFVKISSGSTVCLKHIRHNVFITKVQRQTYCATIRQDQLSYPPCGTRRTLFIKFFSGPALIPCSPANWVSCCINLSIYKHAQMHAFICTHIQKDRHCFTSVQLLRLITGSKPPLTSKPCVQWDSPLWAPRGTGTEFRWGEEIAVWKKNNKVSVKVWRNCVFSKGVLFTVTISF